MRHTLRQFSLSEILCDIRFRYQFYMVSSKNEHQFLTLQFYKNNVAQFNAQIDRSMCF
jgi:hypothetical protein